jgi:hypothetical protein
MKKIVLFLVFVFVTQLIYSQGNFRKGFVISHNRDTTYGFVSYGEGSRNYHECFFKTAENANSVTYSPSEIFGYGFVNDRGFETKKITLDDKSSATVLLEVLVKGLVSLYKFENIYYIDKADTGLIKLSHESIESSVQGVNTSRLSTKYLGVLRLYMSDCNEVASKISNVNCNEKELTNLVGKYDACKTGKSVIYKEKKSSIHLRAGISGGLVISSIDFGLTESGKTYLNNSFESSKTPLAALSLNISSPRINENISIVADLIYFKSNYYSYYTKTDLSQNKNTDYVSISMSQLKIPFGLRYTIPAGKLKPYLSIGFSSTYTLSSETDWKHELETRSVEPFATVARRTIKLSDEEALQVKKNRLGYWGEAGIEKAIDKKINGFFAVRYEKAQGLYTEILPRRSSGNTCIQFIIGINTK